MEWEEVLEFFRRSGYLLEYPTAAATAPTHSTATSTALVIAAASSHTPRNSNDKL